MSRSVYRHMLALREPAASSGLSVPTGGTVGSLLRNNGADVLDWETYLTILPSANVAALITAVAAADKLLTLKQHASQTGDALRVETSAAVVQWRVEGGQGGSTCIGGTNNLASTLSTRLRVIGSSTAAAQLMIICEDSAGTIGLQVNNAREANIPGSLNVGVLGFVDEGAGLKMAVGGSFLAGGTDNDGNFSGVYIGSTSNATGVTLDARSRATLTTVRELYLGVQGRVVGIGTTAPVSTSSLYMRNNDRVTATDSGSGTRQDTLFVDGAASIQTSPGNGAFRVIAGRFKNSATRVGGTGTVTLVGCEAEATMAGGQRHRSYIATAGMMSFTAAALAAVNGNNDDLGEPGSSFVRITGPTAAFNITSFRGGSATGDAPESGDLLIVYNTTTLNMTITNEAGTGTAANRIHTSTGADLATTGEGCVTLIYDATLARWRDIALSP